MISRWIETEAKKAHKPGERSHMLIIGELQGRGLVCEIETMTKFYSVGFLARYTKICTNENFPLYGRRIKESVLS